MKSDSPASCAAWCATSNGVAAVVAALAAVLVHGDAAPMVPCAAGVGAMAWLIIPVRVLLPPGGWALYAALAVVMPCYAVAAVVGYEAPRPCWRSHGRGRRRC